jgi:hypothetical protein
MTGIGALQRGAFGSWAMATRYSLSCTGTKPDGTILEHEGRADQQHRVHHEHDRGAQRARHPPT